MKQTQHPNLRLDLDISHFVVEGNEMTHSVNICAPYTSMVHIKDGKKKDGVIHFCLPGVGDIDITGFFRALRVNQLEDLPVFAEVSQQQSSQPIYDPKSVADFCFSTLNKARTALD